MNAIRKVPCPRCGAEVGAPCMNVLTLAAYKAYYHEERVIVHLEVALRDGQR